MHFEFEMHKIFNKEAKIKIQMKEIIIMEISRNSF
jgi:hypothetical protein